MIVLLAHSLAGCGGKGTAGTAEVVVRDSAGVRVVEVPESAAPAWPIAAEPSLAIGEEEGARERMLDRVAAALQLDDGRVVVADGGSGELRFFGADGAFLTSSGRSGEGPGEFRQLAALRLAGDSLLAYDFGLRRFSVFTAEGVFVRSFTLRDLQTPVSPAGRFDDGRLLLTASRSYGPDDVTPGLQRDPVELLLYDAAGSPVGSVGRFPGFQAFVRVSSDAMMVTRPPFGLSTQVAVDGTLVHVAENVTAEIRSYTPDGTLRRILREARQPLPVTAEAQARFREGWLAGATGPEERRRAEENLRELPFPRTMPAYQRLFADRTGNLWAAEYVPPGADSVAWTVYAPDGRPAGRQILPEGLRVTDAGADYLLGVRRNDLDVQQVVMFRLSRS